jgi:hypothetical protein
MKKSGKIGITIICSILFVIGTYWNSGTVATTVTQPMNTDGHFNTGMILFTPFYSTTTFLMDCNGTINHTWHSAYTPMAASYMLDDGTILLPFSWSTGGFQKIAWNDTILWDYHYSLPMSYCHHDVKPLPNGNVLMICQSMVPPQDAIQAGRNPANIWGQYFLPDFIIEVHQTGPTTGDIVWEWHMMDHLIQDFDPTKDNYGVVGDHPELIDVNFGEYFTGDWIHTNSVDYNPDFDQILLSAHDFDEVWIIDHSTSTNQAAGHEGGIYGHGGDLLYRWGNPQAYRRGTVSNEVLYFQHQCTWIKPGYPGAGNILVFANGNNRPGGPYSTIEEFTPPVDNNGYYYLEPGQAYGPDNVTWHYQATPPQSMYSNVFSGAQRLMNGNTLICDGVPGRFIEVTPDHEVVWLYQNNYPPSPYNSVFKIEYLPPPPPQGKPNLEALGRLIWTDVKPGAIVNGTFQIQNFGTPGSLLNWKVNTSSLKWGTWTITPESGVNLTPEQGPVAVQVSGIVPNEKKKEFQGYLQVLNADNASDSDTVPVLVQTPANSPLPLTNPLYAWLQQWLSLLKDFLSNIGIKHGRSLFH